MCAGRCVVASNRSLAAGYLQAVAEQRNINLLLDDTKTQASATQAGIHDPGRQMLSRAVLLRRVVATGRVPPSSTGGGVAIRALASTTGTSTSSK